MNLSNCSALHRGLLTGTWYRAIQPQHWPTALATNQTRVIPSRFNAGRLNAPANQFDILSLAENHMVALFEVQALLGSAAQPVPQPRQTWIILNVVVQLQYVVDFTQVAEQTRIATNAQELTGDWRGYHQRSPTSSVSHPVGIAPTQELGAALFAEPDVEGFYALSAKLPCFRTLAVFPQKLQPRSQVVFHHPQTGQTHVIP